MSDMQLVALTKKTFGDIDNNIYTLRNQNLPAILLYSYFCTIVFSYTCVPGCGKGANYDGEKEEKNIISILTTSVVPSWQ